MSKSIFVSLIFITIHVLYKGCSTPCTFVSHGLRTTGGPHYKQTTTSPSDCRLDCFIDIRCNGYTHKTQNNDCRLHERRDAQSTPCDSCTFFSKSCETTTCPTTTNPATANSCKNVSFIDHGQNTSTRYAYDTLASNSTLDCENMCLDDYLCRAYKYDKGQCKLSATDVTRQSITNLECEEQCKSDNTCNGYIYIIDIQKCVLSNLRMAFNAPKCKSCHFFSKQCEPATLPSTCNSTSYIHTRPRHRIPYNYTTYNATSYLHCRNKCFEETMCKDFRYNSTSGICRLSATDFYGKKVGSLSECENLCSADIRCFSYFFRADYQRCFMSYLNVSIKVPYCKFCIFSAKECDIVSENSSSLQSNVDQTIFNCYIYHPIGYGVFSIYSSRVVSSWTGCEILCNNDETCKSYGYNSNGSNDCSLSDVTSFNVSCPSCAFALKQPCEINKDTTSQGLSSKSDSFSSQTFTSFGSSIAITETFSSTTNDVHIEHSTTDMSSVTSIKTLPSSAVRYSFSSGTDTSLASSTAKGILEATAVQRVASTKESTDSTSEDYASSTSSNILSPTDSPLPTEVSTSRNLLATNKKTESMETNTFNAKTTQVGTDESTENSISYSAWLTTVSSLSTSNTNNHFSDVQTTQTMSATSTKITTQHTSSESDLFSSHTSSSIRTSMTETTRTVSSDSNLVQTTSKEAINPTSDDYSSTELPYVSSTASSSSSAITPTKQESSISTDEILSQSMPTETDFISTYDNASAEVYTAKQVSDYLSTLLSDAKTTSSASGVSTTQKSHEEPVVITNGTVKCLCVCKNNNHSLEESMKARKRMLTVEKKDLSSTARKRTSAPDFRYSSTTIGSFGIAAMVTLAGLILFADICSGTLFIYQFLTKRFLKQFFKTLQEKPSIV